MRLVLECQKYVVPPSVDNLQIIYKSHLKKRTFPREWERAIAVPVHKKKDKKLVKNYYYISLHLHLVKFVINIFSKF